jgi:transposase
MVRSYGRSLRGKRVFSKQSGQRFKRLNIVAGLCNGEVIAPMYYDCSTTSALFESWFETQLCPCLKEGNYVVLDNASFHRKIAVDCIAKSFNINILWLPPYSPDKNKIEKLWANLKNWLRIFSCCFESIQDAVVGFFKEE